MYQNYNQPPPYGNASTYSGYNSHANHGNQNSYSSPSHMHSSSSSGNQTNSIMSRMDEKSAFSLLQHLGKNELQHLMDNDEKLTDLINDLPQVRGIQEEHDNLIASNKSIAEFNLSLQPRLEDLKRSVGTGYETQNAHKTSLAEDKATLDSFVGRHSLDTLLALLQTETAKVEEESENLTSEFYDSSVNMEDYLNQFIPQRTTMHLRRIKSERMAELIRDRQHGHPPTASQSGYPPGGEGSMGAPYPMGGSFHMPQPGYPYR